MYKIMRKLISVIIIVTFTVVTIAGESFALRPTALVNSSLTQIVEEGPDYVTIRKGNAEHTIVGVFHELFYLAELVEEHIKEKDMIISEWMRSHRPYIENISNIIDSPEDLKTKRPKTQHFHTVKILVGKGVIFNIDVFGKYILPSIYIEALFCIVGLSYITAWIVTLLYSMTFLFTTASTILNCLFLVIIMLYLYCHAVITNTIDLDFRNLIYAEKLSYLPRLFRKADLKTATIVGKAHNAGIKEYLEDDKKREARWAKYADSFYLRLLLRIYLDIEKSMEIIKIKKEGKEKTEIIIGTIAELPGPKKLIAKLKQDSKKSKDKGPNKIFSHVGDIHADTVAKYNISTLYAIGAAA